MPCFALVLIVCVSQLIIAVLRIPCISSLAICFGLNFIDNLNPLYSIATKFIHCYYAYKCTCYPVVTKYHNQ